MEEENMEGIEIIENKKDMALVATMVYDGVVLMYEWLPIDEAKVRVNKVLGREESFIKQEEGKDELQQ